MRLYTEMGVYERGINSGELLVQVDPCSEEFHRMLMELWMKLGQPLKALR